MRIRKQRHLPLLAPPPPPQPSDPSLSTLQELHHHVNISSELIHPHHDVPHHSPSDLQMITLRRQSNGPICSDGEKDQEDEENKREAHKNKRVDDDFMHHIHHTLTKEPLAGVEEQEPGGDEDTKISTPSRRKWGAKATCGLSLVLSSFSSPHPGGTEGWCKGDHSFIKRLGNEKHSVETKSNKTLVIEEEEEEEENGEQSPTPHNKKKRRVSNTGAMQEGSRCSRVNGRGWRCSQQTLVGYSLCEHHLGKGKLRSMSNVSKINASSSLLSEERDEQQTLVTTKKGKKIGVVKARSLSSLLGITQHASNTITT